ncbi:GNAT family N-acetyltransferase [Cyanobacterium aponinum UTEX 3222]|uniref:GCN5-related N-acetyltransferase n=2 Tax=Cyanobacterium aponinum TaxID=379064 RepID=K9Z7G7_CYAAP|nr:GNAT family N-acetyltransferase [Cyanobacterium aponinum]WRL43717.1 GNAT family N-acetyltransferase [Cyanobacterium aponinum UTEX 3222]AFZ54328.1 GCN5-related N-acetyltransferase [Cyanobacterium aponinum PCC 10605]MBD2394771.1 GNAT family N-acetyltransferase [Cyanobacterium aponinum FACHB-4101]PHV62114.1 N-acetyltransferase [Cyanobacterium aponinum IPPAS B-1201]WPF89008.1 GNAT family N-acetyltransferase [Cyanobacterium aponinum AL20115]
MIKVIDADLNISAHREAVVELMNTYALDYMGGGEELSDFAKNNLANELAQRKYIHTVLAFVNDNPAGLIIAIEGFSTFACKPLLNIHDVVVASAYRRRGICKLLLQRIEDIALELGCCKLTLEVLEGNQVAQAAYKAFGFDGYQLNPDMGRALFWQKKLNS